MLSSSPYPNLSKTAEALIPVTPRKCARAKRSTSQLAIWRDIVVEMADYEGQTAQGTRGNSRALKVRVESAIESVLPFVKLFGPEGLRTF